LPRAVGSLVIGFRLLGKEKFLQCLYIGPPKKVVSSRSVYVVKVCNHALFQDHKLSIATIVSNKQGNVIAMLLWILGNRTVQQCGQPPMSWSSYQFSW